MRKVVFAINTTADGFFGHTDGIADAELHEFFTAILRNASIILYGRTTFQLMVPYWPDVAKHNSEDPSSNAFAKVFDSLEKVVFSRTLTHVDARNSRLASSSLVDEVVALKQEPGKDICVGSISLASQLSEHRLIDEYHFIVHPFIAGKGPRMFDDIGLQERLRLDLIGFRQFQSGVVAHHYRTRK